MNNSPDLSRITGGRKDAQEFLDAWAKYVRAVDNIVDEKWYDVGHVMEAMALGCACYSTEFYRVNREMLQAPILVATSLWEQSVMWEQPDKPLWARQWADVLRHSDGIVIAAISMICCGWETARLMTDEFMTAAYIDHNVRRGVPQ